MRASTALESLVGIDTIRLLKEQNFDASKRRATTKSNGASRSGPMVIGAKGR